MVNWFDKRMKKLSKKFDKMFGKIIRPTKHENKKSDENFKTYEKKGPGFHMKIGVFNLTEHEQFKMDSFPKHLEKKEGEVDEVEEEARKLALKRFEEKKEKTKK